MVKRSWSPYLQCCFWREAYCKTAFNFAKNERLSSTDSLAACILPHVRTGLILWRLKSYCPVKLHICSHPLEEKGLSLCIDYERHVELWSCFWAAVQSDFLMKRLLRLSKTQCCRDTCLPGFAPLAYATSGCRSGQIMWEVLPSLKTLIQDMGIWKQESPYFIDFYVPWASNFENLLLTVKAVNKFVKNLTKKCLFIFEAMRRWI